MLCTFVPGMSKVKFDSLVKEGSDVDMVCLRGLIKNLTNIEWYRHRPSGKRQSLWTATYKDDREIENKPSRKFSKKIVRGVSTEPREHSIKLLDVNSNDISIYWCELVGDSNITVWQKKILQVEGDDYLSISSYL